jgi:hypothetical protein
MSNSFLAFLIILCISPTVKSQTTLSKARTDQSIKHRIEILSLPSSYPLSEEECVGLSETNFGKTSAGIRIGYSGLYSFFYGLNVSTSLSSDASDWNFGLVLDNYTYETRYQLTLRANVGRNILLGENLNFRPFIGLGDWIVITDQSPRKKHPFPILNVGLSFESEIRNHVILLVTIEQQFWIPYSFLTTPTVFLIGGRFYL